MASDKLKGTRANLLVRKLQEAMRRVKVFRPDPVLLPENVPLDPVDAPSGTPRKDGLTVMLPGGVPLELVHVPAGTFLMGSPEGEPGRQDWETQHRVTLTRDFWLGKFPVTQGQWRAVMGTTLLDQANKEYPEKGYKHIGKIDDDYPMYWVSWHEAAEFCGALTELARSCGVLPAGYRCALPAEAQWEHACRAGTSTALYSGDIAILGENNAPALDGVAWYGGNSSVGYDGVGWDTKDWAGKQYPGGFAGPREVGGKRPNAWGLYDMIGNVHEWCWDWYGDYPEGAATDPAGPSSSGRYRVIRGGSWLNHACYCRSAGRCRELAACRFKNVGFRVAFVPLLPKQNVVISTPQPEAVAATPPQQQPCIGSRRRSSPAVQKDDMAVLLPGGVPLELVHVPAGKFLMGSPADEPGRYDDETLHRVTLTRDFWLGRFPVTQGQWKVVMGTTLYDQATKAHPGEGENYIDNINDGYPMYWVSWHEAAEFCGVLTEHARSSGSLPAGYRYALPTEAQWEYACRAGTWTALYSGDIAILGERNVPALDGIAWYGGNSSVGYKSIGWDTKDWLGKQYPGGFAGPREVGGKRPNAWGLYDMIGNVSEWCRDWYGAYQEDAATDPAGPLMGKYRVFRGGSWLKDACYCRSAGRIREPADCRFNDVGFRVALVPVQWRDFIDKQKSVLAVEPS